MKYVIHSIDDSRAEYKDAIRENCAAWEELDIESVNGHCKIQLTDAILRHPYTINWLPKEPPRVGHMGVWYSFLDALEYAPLVTFDDDAILINNLPEHFAKVMQRMPEDADFFSLFIPRDSDHKWNKRVVAKGITRVYSTYGGVSFYFTESGKEKIKHLLTRDGILGQYDDVLYAYAQAGELNGYCLTPQMPDLVYITGEEKSIVQESEAL